MNIPLITMPPEDAQAKLDAYRQQLLKRTDEEYELAVTGYAALAKGTPIINLVEAIQTAGLGPDKRPRLAVARADRKQVTVRRAWDRPAIGFSTAYNDNRSGRDGVINIPFPNEAVNHCKRGFALVPMVPADVRPNVALSKCLILWEVEQWSDHPISATPDRDPLLLQRLAGDLCTVLAQWDLTELERAVMAQHRRSA